MASAWEKSCKENFEKGGKSGDANTNGLDLVVLPAAWLESGLQTDDMEYCVYWRYEIRLGAFYTSGVWACDVMCLYFQPHASCLL